MALRCPRIQPFLSDDGTLRPALTFQRYLTSRSFSVFSFVPAQQASLPSPEALSKRCKRRNDSRTTGMTRSGLGGGSSPTPTLVTSYGIKVAAAASAHTLDSPSV